ncbi:MAG: sulfatase-like hydrolase/transferase, partial [Myxococcales bacterium]|nr:sulfatase-like hydrolase/transferase [Myxococcales bacterium]
TRPRGRRRFPELMVRTGESISSAVRLSLLLAFGWGGGFSFAGAESVPPDVLLVTIDTLRPDALGWVAGRNRTPVLDRLADGGVAFSAAVAPAPVTLPSHASILSGLEPLRHGATDNGRPVGACPLLAERLSQAGWRTGAFVSGAPLARTFGLARGFGEYDEHFTVRGRERRASETVAAAQRWLAAQPAGPVFLWVHLYDPHDPYEAPGAIGSSTRDAYDAEVREVDRALAPLLADPRFAGDLVVMAADHGEGLGEFGEATHGLFVLLLGEGLLLFKRRGEAPALRPRRGAG